MAASHLRCAASVSTPKKSHIFSFFHKVVTKIVNNVVSDETIVTREKSLSYVMHQVR